MGGRDVVKLGTATCDVSGDVYVDVDTSVILDVNVNLTSPVTVVGCA